MAMIPNDLVDEYTEYIENAIGEGNVYRMSIRPHGANCVSEQASKNWEPGKAGGIYGNKICYHNREEYGSGGRIVGRKLAEELGLHFYDDEILKMASEKECSRRGIFPFSG